MIITIGGNIGAGKSTVANMLAARYGLKRYSSGDFMRQMAAKRHIPFMELTKQAVGDPSIDEEIDARQKRLGETEDDFVIDGRMAFYFIKRSIKVFLEVSPKEGARRIYQSKRRYDEDKSSYQRVLEDNIARDRFEKERYMKHYGVDPSQRKNYDIWVKTDGIHEDEVARRVITGIEEMTVF